MLLRVQVKPNSRTDSISMDEAGHIRVKICAQPVEGKANKYLIEYLTEVFRISKSRITIIKGQSSSHKIIELKAEETYIRDILKSLKNK